MDSIGSWLGTIIFFDARVMHVVSPFPKAASDTGRDLTVSWNTDDRVRIGWPWSAFTGKAGDRS